MKRLISFEKYSSLKVSLDGKTKMKIDLDQEVLGGKFKNKKIKVKKIGINAKGDIAINDKPFSKFRTNENIENEPMICYWKIPTDKKYLKIILKKIGMQDSWIDYWSQIGLNLEGEYCYIYRHKADDDTYNWTVSHLTYKNIQPHWKYMGEVKLENWEIESGKYNL